jgi:hypothetical protein
LKRRRWLAQVRIVSSSADVERIVMVASRGTGRVIGSHGGLMDMPIVPLGGVRGGDIGVNDCEVKVMFVEVHVSGDFEITKGGILASDDCPIACPVT